MRTLRGCTRQIYRVIADVRGGVGESQHAAGGFRLGITARLLIAFMGVAALVLAANLLVEQEVRVERTTEITRTLPPAVAIHAPPPAPLPAVGDISRTAPRAAAGLDARHLATRPRPMAGDGP